MLINLSPDGGSGVITRYISLDRPGKKMYWSDSETDIIQYADMSPVQEVVSNLNMPMATSIADGHLYWTDMVDGTISRRPLVGTGYYAPVGTQPMDRDVWYSKFQQVKNLPESSEIKDSSIDQINKKIYWLASGYTESFEQEHPGYSATSSADPADSYVGNFSSSGNWYNGYQGASPDGTDAKPYAFLWRKGTTPSGNTGPTNAYRGDYYAYCEASDNPANDGPQGPGTNYKIFEMSRSFGTAHTVKEMSFWYHMFGAAMGTLEVSRSTNGTDWNGLTFYADGISTTSLSGQQQTASADPWREATVNLSAMAGSSFYVKIRSITGDNYTGDLSIDYIQFDPSIKRSDLDGGSVEDILTGSVADGAARIAVSPENDRFYWADNDLNTLNSGSITTTSSYGAITSSLPSSVGGLAYNYLDDVIYFSSGSSVYAVTGTSGDSNLLYEVGIASEILDIRYDPRGIEKYSGLQGRIYMLTRYDDAPYNGMHITSFMDKHGKNDETVCYNDWENYTTVDYPSPTSMELDLDRRDAYFLNHGEEFAIVTKCPMAEPIATYPPSAMPPFPPIARYPIAGTTGSENLPTILSTNRSGYPDYYDIDNLSVPDAVLRTIFYTDGNNTDILKRDKSGLYFGSQILVHETYENANGCAVDYYNKKVYYTKYGGGEAYVQSSSFDGSNWGTVAGTFGAAGVTIRGIAAAPKLGKIFWCRRNGSDPADNTIYSASLHGENIGVVLSGLQDPYDVVIDQENNKLYYVDGANGAPGGYWTNQVFSASVDGSNHGPLNSEIQTLLQTDVNDSWGNPAIDLDRLSQTLYFVGRYTGTPTDTRVHKCDIYGKNASLILRDQQPDSINPIDILVDPWADRLYYMFNDTPDYCMSSSLSNPGTGSENLSGVAWIPTGSGGPSLLKMSFYFEGRGKNVNRYSGPDLYTITNSGSNGDISRTSSPLVILGTNSEPNKT